MKAEKIVTKHDGYTSIKYRYSRKPYIVHTYDHDDVKRVKADTSAINTASDPIAFLEWQYYVTPEDYGVPAEYSLQSVEPGNLVFSKLLECVSRTYCPFCGNVMEKRWTTEENDKARGETSYITRKCSCGHDIDMIVPALDRFEKEGEAFGVDRINEVEGGKERYDALLDAETRVKYNSARITYVNLFNEKYDKVTAMIGYAVTYINEKTGTPALLNGSAKVIMNMKTGMTYIKNGRFFKKDCPDIVKLFRSDGLKSICYGMPSWISYGIKKREYGKMVIDTLEEPEVVRHFAENIVRYKGLDKSSLTQAGDFSDTLFAMVCIANNSPGYTFRSYAMMAHMKDFNMRDRIRRLKADMKKGDGFMAKKYFKGMPKSFRRIIADDPFYYHLFKDLRNAGFTDPNVMRKIANENPVMAAGAMMCISAKNDEWLQPFIKEYINRYGEKRAARMLCSMKPNGRYIAEEDVRMFYDAEQLFSAFVVKNAVSEADMSGRTIREVHDSLSVSYRKLEYPDSELRYETEKEKYEKTVDGYEFKLPRTRYELIEIGESMHNCVAMYRHSVEAGTSTIVTAAKNSRLEMCIEIRNSVVVQARGNCNESLTEEQLCVLNRWANESGLAVEDWL